MTVLQDTVVRLHNLGFRALDHIIITDTTTETANALTHTTIRFHAVHGSYQETIQYLCIVTQRADKCDAPYCDYYRIWQTTPEGKKHLVHRKENFTLSLNPLYPLGNGTLRRKVFPLATLNTYMIAHATNPFAPSPAPPEVPEASLPSHIAFLISQALSADPTLRTGTVRIQGDALFLTVNGTPLGISVWRNQN